MEGAVSVALFIRHGKASAFASSTDYDQLSPPGVEQSEKLGEWLAHEGLPVDAVFVGPRKRHAQTLAAVVRVLATRGLALPEATLLPELDEHDGLSLVFKMLPALAAERSRARARSSRRWRAASSRRPTTCSRAFKRVTRRWVTGEIGHSDVESWSAFRARVARAHGAASRRSAAARRRSSSRRPEPSPRPSADTLGVRDEQRVLDLSWALYNGSVTELDFTGDRWGLRSFNTTGHLVDKRLVTSV